jgi:ABC-type uncharacterized transport system permease subunit
MDTHTLPGLVALTAMLPLTVAGFRPIPPGRDGRDRWFWLALALALPGPIGWVWIQVAGSWLTGLTTALSVTVAACLSIFAALCLTTPSAWRMTRLLLPYLMILTLFAVMAETIPQGRLDPGVPGFWIRLHIVVSVITYALVTLAAVAALAGVLQEQALKAKRAAGALVRTLPPVAESEALQVRLLALAEAVLGAGLLSGMAVLYYEQGVALRFDHKTLFSVAGFLVIAALLMAHARTGVRGRSAARLALSAYLLLTLAYIGVKFVREVLLTGHT